MTHGVKKYDVKKGRTLKDKKKKRHFLSALIFRRRAAVIGTKTGNFFKNENDRIHTGTDLW